MLAHESEREIRAVGDPVHVPLRDLERRAQVGEVGGVLGRVVSGQVDPLDDEAPAAGPGGGRLPAPGRGGVVDETDPAGDEPQTLQARQIRLGEGHPALVHENELSIAVQPCVDQSRCACDRAAAGTALQVHDGIGRRRRGHGRHDGDRQADAAGGRPAAILGHHQMAAARGLQTWDRIRGDDLPPGADCLYLRARDGLERSAGAALPATGPTAQIPATSEITRRSRRTALASDASAAWIMRTESLPRVS
jgi:hypothetical protein